MCISSGSDEPDARANAGMHPTLASEAHIIELVEFLVSCVLRAGFGRVMPSVRLLVGWFGPAL